MAFHVIGPERRTLHGHFAPDLAPVLTIDPGDTVRFATLDARWGLEPFREPDGKRRSFTPRDPELDGGHALCGPVAVRGAEPGMTLEVQIGEIVPGTYGWNWAGGKQNLVFERLGVLEHKVFLLWDLDVRAMVARNQFGHTVPMRPFFGVMGLAPAEPGRHATSPPRRVGGNIDCKELVAGSSLFLPIEVAGGLFSTGDGHAAQGDGESSITAIECPIDRGDLTFRLHPDLKLAMPRAKTPAGWITFGFHADLTEAMWMALNGMLDLMGELLGMERSYALAMASVAVDLRVTQVVNGVMGVHAVLPHGAVGGAFAR